MSTFKILILIGSLFILNGCAEAPMEDSKTVKTAKACQRAKESNPGVLQGFKITACTYNGVWMVDQFDEAGQVVKRFDFVNQEYAGPESQGNFIPVTELGYEAPGRFQTIRQTLNSKLLTPQS
jgi:hypothetical protein